MKQKLIYTDLDNVFNTGILKYMIIEMVAMCIMPYPFLMDVVYYEDANDFSAGIAFQWNDFLLCLMMFIRLIFIFRVALNNSFYTDPRAQRVCNIYGTDASYYFALKCIMKNDSWIILTLTLPVTLLTFSYQLMLFERHVNASFDNFTTAMWNMMITMLTIGYGDVYPKIDRYRYRWLGSFLCITIRRGPQQYARVRFPRDQSFHAASKTSL